VFLAPRGWGGRCGGRAPPPPPPPPPLHPPFLTAKPSSCASAACALRRTYSENTGLNTPIVAVRPIRNTLISTPSSLHITSSNHFHFNTNIVTHYLFGDLLPSWASAHRAKSFYKTYFGDVSSPAALAPGEL
jgi:hypothetical protein